MVSSQVSVLGFMELLKIWQSMGVFASSLATSLVKYKQIRADASKLCQIWRENVEEVDIDMPESCALMNLM